MANVSYLINAETMLILLGQRHCGVQHPLGVVSTPSARRCGTRSSGCSSSSASDGTVAASTSSHSHTQLPFECSTGKKTYSILLVINDVQHNRLL